MTNPIRVAVNYMKGIECGDCEGHNVRPVLFEGAPKKAHLKSPQNPFQVLESKYYHCGDCESDTGFTGVLIDDGYLGGTPLVDRKPIIVGSEDFNRMFGSSLEKSVEAS